MIIGVGIDVVDVNRFLSALGRAPDLRERLFTPPERHLAPASLAARFAAKEAIAKALGSPGGMNWQDCTVHRTPGGPPRIEIVGTVLAVADRLGVTGWHLSISHDAGIASAFAVAEGG
ncbi:holo-ACP synthase [Pseudactinotalea sp. HY158]|uniref:holo-ACP synthase n=1 Tax=unclassified Pseudactinotalea TaxID=2649176 RepID=UPI00129CA899|nr:holo-ACP synthase [Pseudactinotalea sp. HY158]MPV50763.1 holo-ACP synthase [Pseudactinotalea sp. HY160]QGH70393.1 holo-ACP synthase [Pseudactinotalea sp. HY158]